MINNLYSSEMLSRIRSDEQWLRDKELLLVAIASFLIGVAAGIWLFSELAF